VYLANDKFSTNVVIVNTSTNTAVKAKVVLRSAVNSQEVLDFICYLTPSDVCRFKIYQDPNDLNGDGKKPDIAIYSADDSIKSPVKTTATGGISLVDSLENTTATFASVLPVTQPLFIDRVGVGDTVNMGHIEVIGVYGVRNGPLSGNVVGRNAANQQTFINITPRMSKFSLAQVLDTPRYCKDITDAIRRPANALEDLTGVGAVNIPGITTGCEGTPNNAPSELTERDNLDNGDGIGGPYGALLNSRIRSTDPSWVKLAGNVEVVSNDEVERTGYRFPSLAGSIGDFSRIDVDGTRFAVPVGLGDTVVNTNNGTAGISNTADFDGLVVSNATFDVRGGENAPETGLGQTWGIRTNVPNAVAYTVGLSKTLEIEEALAATDLQQTYEDDGANGGNKRTQLMITFPTRYLHQLGNDVCRVGGTTVTEYTPPFQRNGSIPYKLTAYDEFENPSSITGIPFSGGIVQKDALVEVNYFIPKWPATQLDGSGKVVVGTNDFRRGWYDMALTAATGYNGVPCYYAGLPVLSFAHRYTLDSTGKMTNSWFVPGLHQPVRYNDRDFDPTWVAK
jgi:hypothetical protein